MGQVLVLELISPVIINLTRHDQLKGTVYLTLVKKVISHTQENPYLIKIVEDIVIFPFIIFRVQHIPFLLSAKLIIFNSGFFLLTRGFFATETMTWKFGD